MLETSVLRGIPISLSTFVDTVGEADVEKGGPGGPVRMSPAVASL